MTTRMLLIRSLQHHWRMHVALVLCAVVGSATLTGALIVGDSMRGSLRDNALKRLGPVHYAMRSPRFIRAETAKAVGGCGIVLLQGGIEHAETKSRANRVQIVGANEQFWDMWRTGKESPTKGSTTTTQANDPNGRHGDGAVLNESLATEIGAEVGDEVLIRLARQSAVPADSVLGRPDETAATLRLSVSEIVGDDGVGGFSLDASQAGSFNVIVPIEGIRRTLEREGRINAILVEGVVAKSTVTTPESNSLDSRLAHALSLSDYDLSIRTDNDRGYFSIESDRMLLEPAVEKAIWNRASKAIGDKNPVLAYLANNIERLGTQGEVLSTIPYSIVAAVGSISSYKAASSLGQEMVSEANLFQDDEILLNAWAADDLGAKNGDRIRLTYYVTGRSGELETQSHEFKLRTVLPMSDEVADPGFLPPYPGISDADTLGDWDPPTNFKIDLKRIRPKDEQYWKEHKGSPKAFISIQAGQKLWAERIHGSAGLPQYAFVPANLKLSQPCGNLANRSSMNSNPVRWELPWKRLEIEPWRQGPAAPTSACSSSPSASSSSPRLRSSSHWSFG
ncbi:MAG: hypothetical protein IPK83_01270 [Planctomycetes bacterium]|nr:hypothetical protein [Planctomycetota bacterium]